MEQIDRKPLDDDEALSPEAAVLSRLLAGRYSCRAYRPEPVPRDTIRQMLALAQMSASWCNSQPWQVIVTEGEGTERFRARLFDRACQEMTQGAAAMQPDLAFPSAYRGVYKERQREVGWQLYESVGIAYGDRPASAKQALENFRLFGAPHALILTSERDLGTYGTIDTGLYVGTLLLAAQSLGIGMIPQAALAAHAPLIHDHFGIPENRLVVLGASFGYPAAEHPANSFRSRRSTLDDAVTWVDR
ncbi:nitroreductase [Niveispirillum sp. SYP-B3756]|nr:nitroreductase [Niveispirillum sp. SYP-B3756]